MMSSVHLSGLWTCTLDTKQQPCDHYKFFLFKMTDEERVDIIATNAEEDKEAEPKSPNTASHPCLGSLAK